MDNHSPATEPFRKSKFQSEDEMQSMVDGGDVLETKSEILTTKPWHSKCFEKAVQVGERALSLHLPTEQKPVLSFTVCSPYSV